MRNADLIVRTFYHDAKSSEKGGLSSSSLHWPLDSVKMVHEISLPLNPISITWWMPDCGFCSPYELPQNHNSSAKAYNYSTGFMYWLK